MHYKGDAAEGLLAAWTALWHPALLVDTGSAPTWYPAESPPSDLSGLLIVIPGVSESEIPRGFVERATEQGARTIQGNLTRDQILAQGLAPLGELAARLDDELIADFLALGYCYLQIELLMRQMRYSTNLDEEQLYAQAVAGARAAAEGQVEAARDELTACFDLLAQERDHYYAVDAYVLDITLAATTTLGSELRELLQQDVPVNLLLTAELLRHMAHEAPDTFAELRRRLEAGAVGLIGGDPSEERTPLHSCETVLRRLRAGLATFDEFLGARPTVYGRRRYGLSGLYPQLLQQLGFSGALHATLAEGLYPQGTQLKIRWEGPARQAIDAIGQLPTDASRPGVFLSLAGKLGETMDMDQVATICFAHWPGRVSSSYHDLRRAARYADMAGKFVTVDEYFSDTDYPGQTEQFKADQYRSPYLQQAVAQRQSDPISRCVRYWRQRSRAAAIEALDTMTAAINGRPVDRSGDLIQDIDIHADHPRGDAFDERIERTTQQAVEHLSQLIPRRGEPPETGYLAVNPSSHVRRVSLSVPALSPLPAVTPPVYAADSADNCLVVDVPPMGFAWITPGDQPPKPPRRPPPVLAEEHRLFNEYFEAYINPSTGGIESLYEYEKRGNRLSQQLAVRNARQQQATKQQRNPYSTMVADQVRVTAASTIQGEITTTGRLVDARGTTLAQYEQRCRTRRGSRVLELDMQLDPLAELDEDPWNSYYCCRWAWANEAALLRRAVNQLQERAEAKRLDAPNYIDIDDNGHHVTLLTGGHPFHRRTNLRQLDTLLRVQGERARSFQLGIGVNLAYPLQDSIAQFVPLPTLAATAPPPVGPSSSWLFHVNSRNVVATAWAPRVEEGIVTGFRVRLLETAGRSAHTRIRSCRAIESAERQDFQGQTMGTCRLEDGAAVVRIGGNEWVEISARWES
ncbi:MAG: hypothetical protein ACODAD_00615 [Planctomycetota bacterium]